MKIEDIKVGDYIKDIEDGDCYFYGIVSSIHPINYVVLVDFWDGVFHPAKSLDAIPLQWSELEVFRNDKWHKVI